MNSCYLFSFLFLILLHYSTVFCQFSRICYVEPENGSLPLDIEFASLCTHIICGYSGIGNNSTLISTLRPSEYGRALQLKKLNPNLRILTSNGGNFSLVLLSEENMKRFAVSAVDFLLRYKLDGLDLDWEYPAWAGRPAEQRQQLSSFLQTMRRSLDGNSERRNLTLSMAVGAGIIIMEKAYDIPAISKHLDFVNLMTYDLHFYQQALPVTGYNSPLYPHDPYIPFLNTLNVAWASDAWVKGGLPARKLMLGVPLYAHAYTLLRAECHEPFCPAVGKDPVTDFRSFPIICAWMKKTNAARVWDDVSRVPYAFHGLQWVSYDDVESVTEKAKFIAAEGYGGAMTWNLNNDDRHGVCDGSTRYPLHRVLLRHLPSRNFTSPTQNSTYLTLIFSRRSDERTVQIICLPIIFIAAVSLYFFIIRSNIRAFFYSKAKGKVIGV